MKTTLTLCTAALLLLVPLLALAGESGPQPGRTLSQLDLTSEQREAVRDILAEEREEVESLRETVRRQRGEMRELRRAEPLEIERLRALAHEHADTRVELVQKRSEVRERVHAALTPEQRQQLEVLRAERQERRTEHRQLRQGGDPGEGRHGRH